MTSARVDVLREGLQGASPDGDRATRPSAQAPSGLGDTASVPSAARLGKWINGYDTGLSSKAIFLYMTLGIKGGATPSDPSDFGRCLRLLEAFPEWKARLPEMASVSEEWAALVLHWAELEDCFLREAGGALPGPYARWSAPETYKKMRAARGEVR